MSLGFSAVILGVNAWMYYKYKKKSGIDFNLIDTYENKEKIIAKFKRRPLDKIYNKFRQLGLFNPHNDAKPIEVVVRKEEDILEEKVSNKTPLLKHSRQA